MWWTGLLVYYLCLLFIKISILLQYLRIFTQPRFRLPCFIVMGFCVSFSVWTIISNFILCTPVQWFWDRMSSPNGHCINENIVWFTNAAVNIATDIAIVILPIPSIRGLNLPSRQKKALMVVFGLAGL